MNATVKLTITCSNSSVCGQLLSVLTPDNEGAPRGMSLKMEARNEVLQFRISSEPSVAVLTAIAILQDVRLFQEVWLLSRGSET